MVYSSRCSERTCLCAAFFVRSDQFYHCSSSIHYMWGISSDLQIGVSDTSPHPLWQMRLEYPYLQKTSNYPKFVQFQVNFLGRLAFSHSNNPRPAIISLNLIVVMPANSDALEIDTFSIRCSSIAREIFNSDLVFNKTLKASLNR